MEVLADAETRLKRAEICAACNKLKKLNLMGAEITICGVCLCSTMLKGSFVSQKCPDNPPKW
jgi:hypothetical protein